MSSVGSQISCKGRQNANGFLEELRSGEGASDLNGILGKCRQFLDGGNPLTLDLFSTLFEIVMLAAASQTLPATEEIQEQLSGLLRLLWRDEVKRQLSPMSMPAGWAYCFWSVQRRSIEEAKEVLTSLSRGWIASSGGHEAGAAPR